jgi:hypothetical protein
MGKRRRATTNVQANIRSPISMRSLGGSSILPARRTLMLVTVHGAWVRAAEAALFCGELGSGKNGDEI